MSDEQLNEIQAKAERDLCFTDEEKRVIGKVVWAAFVGFTV